MATNKLAHLVGDYHSDSDNDDSDARHINSNDIITDWTQCTDASTGHPYYWNIVTKDVTWEIPIEYQQFLEQAMLRNPRSLKKWILCYTDDNTPYYFNEVTREISWEKPDDFNPVNNNQQTTKSAHSNSGRADNRITSHVSATTKLNLVPEYNSDESDDEGSKPTEKPLFPSSKNSYPENCQLPKAIDIQTDATNDKIQPESQIPNSPKNSDHKIESNVKEKPSFASIITGGRSPQHETVDIKQYLNEECDESLNRPEEVPNETELSQKTFQRKRRIEFDVSSIPVKRTNQNEDSSMSTEAVKDMSNSVASLRSNYSHFQKGETEFGEKPPQTEEPEDRGKVTNNELRNEQQLLEAKLNFLCQGRADVSPVQIIQIQLQALQTAHVAEALHSDYLLEWMKNISNDLVKLENDAAPTGWKCLWNREKAQYCYENTSTGEIKWEYPDDVLNEVNEPDDTVIADDAMDICTTPPPNEHEDLSAAFYQSKEYHAAETVPPPPPKWSTNETAKNNNDKPLDDELATFYSDIAKLEPETTIDENSCDKSPTNPDQSVSPEHSACDADDKKKKKKKKKVNKLEPWRSGNLETWINKWQKAQKELDG